MYPTTQEQEVIQAAENIMIETMARYDPSHDKYHGEHQYYRNSPWSRYECLSAVQRVRKTALALARSLPSESEPDLLVIELGL